MAKKDSSRTLYQLVIDNKYPYEQHNYETEDGYINKCVRISGTVAKKNVENGGPRKPVVVLQHGLNCSCTDWILNGDKSLGFILADNGFDVWMNNTRGNRYSRHHVYLDPDIDRKEFWDYSFEEMGKYDQPALINYVIQKTGVKSVTYIGHSQGTTQMFCALSENFDFFKEKINLFIALAPVVKVESCSSGLIKKIKDNQTLENLLIKNEIYEITPAKGNNSGQALFHKLLPEISNFGIKLLSDDDPRQVNQSCLEGYLSHYPSGTSLKTLLHFKQLMNKKQFEHYDYGAEENLKRYGQEEPPLIPLQNIQGFPIALLAGSDDHLANINDVRWLKEQLQQQDSLIYYQEYPFGHLAFLLPNTIKHFQDCIDLVKRYNPVYISGARKRQSSQNSGGLNDSQLAIFFQSTSSQQNPSSREGGDIEINTL
ncbi:ab-hydrolase associated lipase region family protein [Stylonychia lemnae]|uniref:Lipase n=1 Tax=Stylonychia lemnae TaxID=5949 RepID=A0A078AB64_STYLE|nr:ab-hydrolase associated lipase region family protein [Stylonychia lemnae]|eukprot:CDW79126.1 ab-hydrolase associated lipase region family protein [Stylonychia lemnae]